MRNTLFYGDNLDILRKHVPDACVDLVYLDPPFNSNRDYNVLFKEQSGEAAQSLESKPLPLEKHPLRAGAKRAALFGGNAKNER